MNKYLKLAKDVASFSECLRVKYGAVIVKNDLVVSTGFNTPLIDVQPCKKCSRLGKQHGKDYNEKCPTLHAEEWAIIEAIRCGNDLDDSTIFISGIGMPKGAKPCYRCERLMKAIGIKKVVVG